MNVKLISVTPDAEKNIAYCARDGVNPLKHFEAVVRLWGPLSAAHLKTDDGRELFFPDVVSFTYYFNHRSIIDPFVIGYKGKTEGRRVMTYDELESI